jgi:H+/Cl- antiporter ClcA
MVEGTGGIEFLLPVILAIVLSNWVAHHIHSTGAYESDLERIGTSSATYPSLNKAPTLCQRSQNLTCG